MNLFFRRAIVRAATHCTARKGEYVSVSVVECRYALMMRLAHDAIQRHSTVPTMIYISLDQVGMHPAKPTQNNAL